MTGKPATGGADAPAASTRVFHVTVADLRPDGTQKAFTMLVPGSTSHAEAVASLKVRFGADRVLSVI